MGELEQTQQEGPGLFEFEYCNECGGDEEHHKISLLFDLPRAVCKFPPDEETGGFHPTIAAFRKEEAAK